MKVVLGCKVDGGVVEDLLEVFPNIGVSIPTRREGALTKCEIQDSIFEARYLDLSFAGKGTQLWLSGGGSQGSSALSSWADMGDNERMNITSIEVLDTWVYTHLWMGEGGLREEMLRIQGEYV